MAGARRPASPTWPIGAACASFSCASGPVVFHAAAYKHVPLVEANPDQGFATNVLGTLAVARRQWRRSRARRGDLDRQGRQPLQLHGPDQTRCRADGRRRRPGRRQGDTVLSAVRFGNVLGSRGSVVPTLLRQIDAGGPITITDPDAQRFFMTVEEAASLVLLSAAYDAPVGCSCWTWATKSASSAWPSAWCGSRACASAATSPSSTSACDPARSCARSCTPKTSACWRTERAAVWRVEPDYMVDGRGSAGGCPRPGAAPPVTWRGACGLPRTRAAPDRGGNPRYVRGRRRSLTHGRFAALGEIRVCGLVPPARAAGASGAAARTWCEPDCGGIQRHTFAVAARSNSALVGGCGSPNLRRQSRGIELADYRKLGAGNLFAVAPSGSSAVAATR